MTSGEAGCWQVVSCQWYGSTQVLCSQSTALLRSAYLASGICKLLAGVLACNASMHTACCHPQASKRLLLCPARTNCVLVC